MEYYNEIIDASDLLLTGKSELKLLFGDCDKAIASLLSQADRIIAVKDGRRGTYIYTRDRALTRHSSPGCVPE